MKGVAPEKLLLPALDLREKTEGPDGFVSSPTSRRTLGPLQTADRVPRGPRGLVPEARGEPSIHRIGAVQHSNQIEGKPVPVLQQATRTRDETRTSCLRQHARGHCHVKVRSRPRTHTVTTLPHGAGDGSHTHTAGTRTEPGT